MIIKMTPDIIGIEGIGKFMFGDNEGIDGNYRGGDGNNEYTEMMHDALYSYLKEDIGDKGDKNNGLYYKESDGKIEIPVLYKISNDKFIPFQFAMKVAEFITESDGEGKIFGKTVYNKAKKLYDKVNGDDGLKEIYYNMKLQDETKLSNYSENRGMLIPFLIKYFNAYFMKKLSANARTAYEKYLDAEIQEEPYNVDNRDLCTFYDYVYHHDFKQYRRDPIINLLVPENVQTDIINEDKVKVETKDEYTLDNLKNEILKAYEFFTEDNSIDIDGYNISKIIDNDEILNDVDIKKYYKYFIYFFINDIFQKNKESLLKEKIDETVKRMSPTYFSIYNEQEGRNYLRARIVNYIKSSSNDDDDNIKNLINIIENLYIEGNDLRKGLENRFLDNNHGKRALIKRLDIITKIYNFINESDFSTDFPKLIDLISKTTGGASTLRRRTHPNKKNVTMKNGKNGKVMVGVVSQSQ